MKWQILRHALLFSVEEGRMIRPNSGHTLWTKKGKCIVLIVFSFLLLVAHKAAGHLSATGQEAHRSSVAPPVCLHGHVSDVDVRACLVPLVVHLEAKALLVKQYPQMPDDDDLLVGVIFPVEYEN